MNILKPCPFCGGEASRSTGHNGINEIRYYVECLKCASMSEWRVTQELADNSWNMRVEPMDGVRQNVILLFNMLRTGQYIKAEKILVDWMSEDKFDAPAKCICPVPPSDIHNACISHIECPVHSKSKLTAQDDKK